MLEELVRYATRVAYNMSKDHEVESLANVAAWKASLDFDPTKNVPIKRWVALRVKQYVWNYWRTIRRRKEEQKAEHWWRGVYTWQNEDKEAEVRPEDWALLYRNRVDRISLYWLARETNTTVYAVRQRIRAAEARVRSSLSKKS